jgi:hypothetical protein
MDEKYYTTPNGTIVGESTLRSKYGEKFDSFLSDGKITEVAETIYETPNGILVQESVLKDKYGEKFNTFLSDGKLKKKEQTKPTQTVQAQQKAPTQAAPLPGLGGVSEEPTQSPVRAPKGIKRTTEVKLPQYDSPSTVLMAHYGDYSPPEANGKYVAFPTIFPKDPDNQTSSPNDWIVAESEDQAYEIAKKRGEVLYYDTQEEAASVAEGSWKENKSPTPSVGQGVLRNVDRTQPRGEAFIQGVSDLTRTDVREPKVSGEELPTGPTGPTGATGAIQPVEFEGVAVTPTGAAVDLGAQYREEKRVQSERNENIKKYGLDVTKGQLTDVFEFPIPEEEDIESYLSKQVGRVTASANNIVNNPKAFGLPADISQMNPNEREEVVDRYIARNYEFRGNGVNMSESELRNVFNQKFDQALAKKKADRDVMLAKESDDELLKSGVSEEGLKPYKLAKQKQGDVASLNPNEKKLYEANVKLQDLTSQIKSITSKYEKETGGKITSKVGGKPLDQRISDLNREGDNLTKLQEKGFTDQASLDAFNKRVDAYNSNLESINKEIESEKIKQDKIQKDYAKDQETLSKLMGEYKSQQEVAKSLMSNLGDDRRIMVDYLTGQHVDKLSDDDDADITEAVNAQIVEFNQPTYKDQLDDIYIKVGLRDQRHREYGDNVTDDVTIGTKGMARDFSSDAAINRLRSLGYEEVGGVGEVTFKNVPLREQASSYVINVLGDDKRERADRWIATNKQNLIEREALKNMVLLNVDPGKFEKGISFNLFGKKLNLYPSRGVEVLAEELLPSYASVDKALGFTSDRKLIDAALPLLQEEGIELTKEQEKNLERTFGEQATEATFGMIPFIGKVVAVNYMLGPVRALSGFDDLIRVLKSGDRVSSLSASFLEALFEEGAMQAADAPTGMGFGFSVGGKLFKSIGLDKFPLRPTGDWARSNKALDAFWSHAIKGTSSAEFASVVEAMIKDYEGGETFKNFAEENYSDLDAVTQRMLVNAISFSALGVKDLGFFIQKGKSGFNISNMEKARDEAQRKGYKEEADMLTKYINEYYAGKPGKAQPASYNDMKLFVENVPENESRRFTVSSLEEVPVEFRDRAKKNESVETEVDRTFLGIPLGKKKVNSGESYSYEITGKEIREVFNKKKEGKTETEFEEEFDMSQKAEEPPVSEEVTETETTVTEPTGDIVPAKQKGRLTRFSTSQDGIVGEVTYEDGTRKELTQEEYDALEKQEGLFDVETGTQPVAETPVEETVSAPTEVAEEAAPVELKEGEIDITTVFKNPVEKNNEQAVAASNEFKDKAGEYDEGVNDPKFKEENTTVEEISVDDIIPTQERLFEKNLKSPSEGEPLVMKIGDKYYVEDGHHRIGNEINADKQTVSVRIYESDKAKQDAVQKQAAGKVPVQPEAKAGEKVEEGKPQAEAKVTAQEGKEVLSEEDAKSEEKVKELVEKQMSDEKKNEEADKEIESKSEEELKEDVPDVLESISETEREKLDREAKFKGKSTIDYVIDYLKGKLKNVRQSIKNILEKLKSNYKKSLIATAIVAELFGGVAKAKIAYEYLNGKEIIEAYETGGKEAAAIKFAEENPEIFKTSLEVLKYTNASPKTAGRLANTGIKAGVIEPVNLEYKESDYTKEDGVSEGYFDRKTNDEIIEVVKDRNGLDIASTRSTFPASVGTEVILQGNNKERKSSGKTEIDGAKYIAHYGLDDNVLSGKRHKDTPPIHRRSMEIDGFVPYVLKKVGDRVVYTYKRYSEIADTSKDIYDVLKDRNILDPLRQYNYDDIQWSDTIGTEVYSSSNELLLKEGTRNIYREGIKKHDAGKPAHPLGTYIMWTPNSKKINKRGGRNGQTNYGRYNGGSFVLIFNDKEGNRFVRNYSGSVDGVRREGESVAKEFGIPTSEITVAFHDAGSVSGKPVAVDGKITERENHMVNDHNPNATFGYVVPMKNEILTKTSDPISGERETPIGLMALPLLFAGTGRKRRRKPLEDADADKVVTDWMEDVQKIYDAQKTKDKQEAVNEAATNLALSGRLNEIAPDQRLKVLEDIAKQTAAMDEKKSVSITSELQGLTLKEQFKQGFEEYVSAMKQKESDRKEKAKEDAQKKIDAVKERTAKAIERIKAKKAEEKEKYKGKIENLEKESKANKEARKLFEAIVNDLAKDSGLSQISRNKASELLKSSRDVNAENLERLLEKAVRVIQYEYTRNIVKESDKKISDFKKNIEKNNFGTLTQSAKELAEITTQDIPLGLLPRFVDVIDGVSKKSPSAKDLDELAKFMSEFKNELDQQITDIQFFADVLNDFKTQKETEEIDDYLKQNGFTESQIEFFKNNRKAINAAYKSFYTKDGKELTTQEKIQKISEQMLDAKKVFREMKSNGEAKVDLKKFKGQVQRAVDIADFFNNIQDSDIDYLTRTEANKLPVVFDNLNRGMVTSAEKRIMNRIKGGRDLDAFEKEDPSSPIKRAKTKDGIFKSFVSNAAEFSKLERSFDPSVLKSSRELQKDIEKKVLDYADEAIKGLKGKPLYNQISKVIRPLVGSNTKVARVHETANELFKKMDGSPLHNTTLMSVYFRSREFDLNPNNPKIKNPLQYIDKTLENTKLSEKKRAILKGIKNEYFRNGKPLTKEMLSFIEKSKGGPLIEFMDEVMASTKEDVRFMSEVDESNPAEFFDGYQPRSTMENGNKSIEDLLSDVSNSVGRPSLRTSAVQSRKSTVNALTFDAMDDFMRTAASIELQKNVAPALAEVNAFISEAKRSGNEDARIFAETLRGVLDSYVKNTLARDYNQKGLYGNLWSSMGRKVKKNTLSGISKATVESLIQLGKIHIDEDASNAFYKNASMDRNVSNQDILTALNSMNVARAGVLSSEMSRKRSFITDAVRRGDAGKVEELIYSASKTIPGRIVSGIDDFAGDLNTALIKVPDLVGTVQVVIGSTAIRFKEITGKELDFDKLVNDPEYRAKYKAELDASIAYGDQIGTRMGGPGAMEQKSLQDIKGGDIRDLNRFVRSFSTNENEQILSSLTTLGVPTSNVVMGKRERGAEFENKKKAARGLASSLFGLGAYTSLRMAVGTIIMGLFGAILNGDDWDDEFDYWDWDVFKARVLGDTIWTAMFGKFGIVESLIAQTLISYGIKQAYKASGKEELGNKIADGMFYSTIDQNDKATKTFKMLGPEGKLAGSILETMYIASDAYEKENFDLLSDPRFKNNLFTISKGAMNIPSSQDIGVGVRKAWYGRDENRKVRESFGKMGDSKIIDRSEKEVLRLYKKTRDRFVLPSIIKDKPRRIRERGVSAQCYILKIPYL